MTRRTLYKALFVLGAVSAAATPPLVYLAGARDVGEYGDAVYLAPVFFGAGALAFWKQPDHRCARWLLAARLPDPGVPRAGARAGGRRQRRRAAVDHEPARADRVSRSRSRSRRRGSVYAVFPDGRYGRGYERLFVRAVVGAAVVLPLVAFFTSPRQEPIYTASSPATDVPWAATSLPAADLWLTLAVAPVVGVLLLVLRYRRAGPMQRTQMRWPVAAAALVAIALASTPLMLAAFGVVAQAAFFMLAATTLRYRS